MSKEEQRAGMKRRRTELNYTNNPMSEENREKRRLLKEQQLNNK
jgi:hypothetical protein